MNPITPQDLSLFYQNLLQQQTNSYSTLIAVLLTVTTGLIASTWFWNLFSARKQIKSEVESKLQKIDEKMKITVRKEISQQIKKVKVEFNNTIFTTNAELSRSFALQCTEKQLFAYSFGWWMKALNYYLKANMGVGVRMAVESLANLTDKLSKKDMVSKKEDIPRFKAISKRIPDDLYEERGKITKFLSKI